MGRPLKITYTLVEPALPKLHRQLRRMNYGVPWDNCFYVYAWHKKEIVGVFSFAVDVKKHRYGKTRMLSACGTSVAAKYRKRGIGVGLWTEAIKHSRPTHIDVTTISKGGRAMVLKLSKLFPKIDWMDVGFDEHR